MKIQADLTFPLFKLSKIKVLLLILHYIFEWPFIVLAYELQPDFQDGFNNREKLNKLDEVLIPCYRSDSVLFNVPC